MIDGGSDEPHPRPPTRIRSPAVNSRMNVILSRERDLSAMITVAAYYGENSCKTKVLEGQFNQMWNLTESNASILGFQMEKWLDIKATYSVDFMI